MMTPLKKKMTNICWSQNLFYNISIRLMVFFLITTSVFLFYLLFVKRFDNLKD